DTRVLSTYRFALGGYSWKLLSRDHGKGSRIQWHFQNDLLRASGIDVPEGRIHFRVRRALSGALHDDLRIESFADLTVRVRLSVQIDADFADVFEILNRSM